MAVFTGVGVALLTLLTQDGSVDAPATAALASDLAARGMRAILVCGTTGEAATLTDAERVELISAVRSQVPAAVPVLAGTGATTAERAADLTAAAVSARRRCRPCLASARQPRSGGLLWRHRPGRLGAAGAGLPHPLGVGPRRPA